jgi:folate-dependent phosphoribosylglycinamide formyltransferase PurN
MALRIAELGTAPVGAIVLRTLDLRTVRRKLGQWGPAEVLRYTRNKVWSPPRDQRSLVTNCYLEPWLKRGDHVFRSLREIAAQAAFPIIVSDDQNSSRCISQLKAWSPDLIVFAGGNILRKQVLHTARLGVLNVHLGLLPEVRGMSTPEWSLLGGVPVGITIHFIDEGIDSGPILRRYELPDAVHSGSLSDIRNRLIALGVDKIGEVIAALESGLISAKPQPDRDRDNQYFVMHEWLQSQAAKLLTRNRTPDALHG